MLLDIGFKSLSYELQKQQPAYDSNSLFGKKRDIFYLRTALHYLAIFGYII